jgi:hypothetical protein
MTEECANPLLLGWIKEWLDQARERNSKGVTVSEGSVFMYRMNLLIPPQLQESLRFNQSMPSPI